MPESFDSDWLALREPFDARARNLPLATRLAAALPARPRILDLGAGTGALLRWLAPIIARPQSWTLVDQDRALLARARAPANTCRVRTLVADLRHAPAGLPLDRADAVVCTALCDLVSEGWIIRMAAALAAGNLPFYSALNVDGREIFSPPHRADALVASGFARDQARDKGFGGMALGPRAPDAIARHFRALGYTVLRAPSPWTIPRSAPAMATALADGHAQAADRAPRHHAIMSQWRDDRRTQARAGRLSARIGHMDILALPPNA